jgi:hemerythrin-like domain-containing protein/quercetin dioxygenase-like cupin family protein
MTMVTSHVKACDSLIAEHRQMEALLEELNQTFAMLTPAPQPADLAQTRMLMQQIETHINTHFACEEQVLFPAVSPYHPMMLMEVEHEQLINQRDDLIRLLAEADKPDTSRIQSTGRQFITEMLNHIAREDTGIFPTCEQALSDAEKRDVIQGMAVLRQQAAHQPLPSITRPPRTFQVTQLALGQAAERNIMVQKIAETPSLDIKHLTIQAGQSLANHWSPKPVVIICLAGVGEFLANETTVPLSAGTLITLSPQLNHRIDATTQCELLLLLQSPSVNQSVALLKG